MEVGLDWNVYAGNPRQTLGLPFADVEIEGDLGEMPAWLIPARGVSTSPAGDGGSTGAWAIFVHGINSSPQTGLRIAPVLRRAGMPSLLITYREDLGAPESPDGYHHMGLTEWRDLDAAVRYALDHGARELVLVGYSMGGAIVAQFMQKSTLAERVGALILDAPALEWQSILEFNATEMGLPSSLSLPVKWAIEARIDADWESLDAVEHADEFHLPILLFHGTEDELIPIETSDEFAEELSEWVTYYRVRDAGHTQAWNVDPRLYQERVAGFLGKSLQIGAKRSEPDRGRARAAE